MLFICLQHNYNRAHMRTRVLIEQTFGVIKRRFPGLNLLRMEPRRASQVITACAAQH